METADVLSAAALGAAPPMGFFSKLLKKFASTSVFCGPPAALPATPAVGAAVPTTPPLVVALKL